MLHSPVYTGECILHYYTVYLEPVQTVLHKTLFWHFRLFEVEQLTSPMGWPCGFYDVLDFKSALVI